MNPMQQRANNYVTKTFKLAPQQPPEDQSKLQQSLQAVVKARAQVLAMFGKR